ncbi:DNA-directed RNA polymerase subunit beta' [Candidatus Phytoplasma australiense]|uniref:DNA-directed RNA polymerase subunit beta' n=1 Tax=Strawberry lethal yellows phytoplasma (CPA) str. NZSb11 TaxID=980422 RepID=R4S0V2_PHYAS|nr:DNA-directed RNA polymerase subunit beta' [Candidatus Phytoplasma australiense]AGL90393.1 DNA-directed RNA polymerase beta' chain [Strawberry lethal yellows phytoplasma (CPA) str. NZSb11]
MNDNKLFRSIETLNFSFQTLEKLKLSGINNLEDFNTFSLEELRSLLQETFLEVLPILKQFALPRDLKKLNLNNDIIEKLTLLGIYDFEQLLKAELPVLTKTFQTDLASWRALNELFELHQHLPPEGLIVSNKKYGSRDYDYFKIRLASPEEIRQWSYGEVTSYETINYRTYKPEPGGLFCQKIFGPVVDYRCACSKKQISTKSQFCNKCHVEFTETKVRRERMGHIELQAPVVHTWYFNSSPSRLAVILNIKAKALEEIIYYISYVVIDPGKTDFKEKEIISKSQYSQNLDIFGPNGFVALTGAEAIRKLLENLDLEKTIKILRKNLSEVSKQKRGALIKRLEIMESLYQSDNNPEWMVMDVIPVLPPGLRPMVPLDGGRFATTEINDLYRRILNRNNRLKKQMLQKAPSLIIQNEKRMLQEAVDCLFDGDRNVKKNVNNIEKNRPLKSLSEMLRGKQGRFRQNLLGKRVDYSGRSVIIVGPDLKMHQCGIPREMAIILFKPFILKKLQETKGIDKKNANSIYEKMNEEVWNVLEEVVKEHPVLLNRAPTLHRLGIQAFDPKLIDGKAIRLHPLVTPAFNADFDGDQMAVYIPLSLEAQAEARLLMLASNNILDPKNGSPVVTPSQDMVLGNYYLTIETKKDLFAKDLKVSQEDAANHQQKHRNEGAFFADINEVKIAYQSKEIGLHTRIFIKPRSINLSFTEEQKEKYLMTTLGKLIFNNILPPNFPYINEPTETNLYVKTPDRYFLNPGENPKSFLKKLPLPKPFNKKFLSMIIACFFKQMKITETSKMLDKIKDLGFKYSTIAGITVSFADINIYSEKDKLLSKVEKRNNQIENWYKQGFLTDAERRRLVINEWKTIRDQIQEGLMKEFPNDNHIFMMSESGARGSVSNFTQLAGMRGLMNNPKGEIIEVPVKASFREGLKVSEFFISTHGARKGSTDTALKTAESGYLTRRLVDVTQDVVVIKEDCGSDHSFFVEAMMIDGKEIISLKNRILGRCASRDVLHPKTGDVIVSSNELINETIAQEIIDAKIKKVPIRSVLNCSCEYGICAKDYGFNLATNKPVEAGEAVGVIAAQSIGEPGTQLTMRTFHTGGVASALDITQGLPRIEELFEARKPKGKALISEFKGKVKKINKINSPHPEIIITTTNETGEQEHLYVLDPNVDILVSKNDDVYPGQKLTSGSIDLKELLRVAGTIETQKYILAEVQKVYRDQNVFISDKHIEIIIHQMFKQVFIIDEGDTKLLPGTEISINNFKKANLEMLKENKRLAVGRLVILGITRASLRSDSLLSAASFQETTKILIDAAIQGKSDYLYGLKENVIIGGLTPSGTGVLETKEFEYRTNSTPQNENKN